ncbi:MAG: hypothetical protein LCH61_17220 [Proteobacteria bacterium]|nr:hypothetical protein [Pseudomonadota bacterium]
MTEKAFGDLLLALMQPRRVNVDVMDPVKVETMRKTYGFEPTTGDPMITMAMDPNRVQDMHPLERPHNLGSYDSGTDAVYLNPETSENDRRETAQHEFRHRGAGMLDALAGRGGGDFSRHDFYLEELAMLMMDMQQGIGTDGYNIPAIQWTANDLAASAGTTPAKIMSEADAKAATYNREARDAVGGGAEYRSVLQYIANLMNDRGPR